MTTLLAYEINVILDNSLSKNFITYKLQLNSDLAEVQNCPKYLDTIIDHKNQIIICLVLER